ncbi:MAG: dockerin type I repeat-containing protein [Ruminococcus sp.]|nr:dockerin type I repeat-containing protein [Ruminococcus sp.]
MKTSEKKLFSLVMALIIALSLSVVPFGASAAEDLGKVRVVVKNETFSTEDSAAWAGELLETDVSLDSNSTMMTVIEDALKSNKIEYSFNNYNYLASVNGLSEYAYNGSGGWMMTLNDWFTSEGSDSYSVEKGSLGDGDFITVLYTCSWGADVGSLWGDSTTTLSKLSVEGASFAWGEDFTPSKTEYTLMLDPGNDSNTIGIIPKAFNKNYQVKTYLNQYTPEQPGTEIKTLSQKLTVKEGDVIYIGVGNNNWDTMNQKADETVYKLKVTLTAIKGDVDMNGVVNINDVTLLQKYLAKAVELNENQIKAADCTKDGTLTIADATAIQKMIAKFI